MSYHNLNNVCFGKVIFGMEDLLAITNVTPDSETLDWTISKCDVYDFHPDDFV